MPVRVLPALPSRNLPHAIRDVMPEYLEAGGYRLRLNHTRNALILQERPHDHRWVFTTFMQYSLLLLLLDRMAAGQRDEVSLEEALQVTGLWTGEVTKAGKRNLSKHVRLLQLDLSPWFVLQTIMVGGTVAGYRLTSTVQPAE